MSTPSLEDMWSSSHTTGAKTSSTPNPHDEDTFELVGTDLNARSSIDSQVFSSKELCDDILATMPKLQAAVRNNARGDRWKYSTEKQGIYLAELKSHPSSMDIDDDTDILHAGAAKTELRCHLNEALSVLLHQDSASFDATMKALCGKQFFGGSVHFHQRVETDVDSSQQAAISIVSATIQPSTSLKTRLQTRHKHTEQFIFSTYTRQFPDKKHAVHLMKTVPQAVHDQVLPRTERLNDIDHLGVGFDFQFTPRPGGSNHQCTRIFAYAYASDKPASTFSKEAAQDSATMADSDVANLARRRMISMNAETRSTMQILLKSLSQFERVIRRRRFGFQSFIYFPKEYADPVLEKCCSICSKTFRFFRRDFYCQLCGHLVCGNCSALYEVEASIGEIRKNRCCTLCVVRVDACTFDDDDLLAALGPIVVDAPPEAWAPDENSILSASSKQEGPDLKSENNLVEQLCSADPEARSRALDILEKLVRRSSSSSASSPTSSAKPSSNKGSDTIPRSPAKSTKCQVQRVLANVESHLNEELTKSRLNYNIEACEVSDRTRDYKFEFDAAKVSNADLPLAPVPEALKDARRVELIKSSGALQSDYDRSALNLIAEVAAKRLGCPIGVVSMIDDQQFHAVGNYNLPHEAHHLPRNEVPCMHAVYAEKPLVIKNPQRDMRFAKMPCVADLGVKFYAGFPLRAPSGEVVGNLCAIDSSAHRHISTKDYSTMATLAKLASDLL